MAYAPIPKDLSNVKTKIIFNLTKRQLICFSLAIAVGVPVFLLTKDGIGISPAVLLMMLITAPFFLLAMYEKHNQPLEVLFAQYVHARFINPKKRPYMTDNSYAALERQHQLDKEIQAIVKTTKAHASGEETASKRCK